jgi:hypothetical protein
MQGRTNIKVQLSLIVTLTLALAEGMRRLFHFEQQWATSNRVERAYARSTYLDRRVLHSVGSKQWVKEYFESRRIVAVLINSDSEEFFEAILSQTKAPAPSGGSTGAL